MPHPEPISDEMAMLLMQAAAPIYAAYLAARLLRAEDGPLPREDRQILMSLALAEAQLLWRQVARVTEISRGVRGSARVPANGQSVDAQVRI
jgi:hypothetical protein